MLFNSVQFLLFYPIVTALHFALPHRARWALLLAASVVFYMAFVPAYVLILAFTILVDWSVGIALERTEGRLRRGLLTASIVANIGVLAFFKYYGFARENVDAIAHALHIAWSPPLVEVLLPIGLSFHTFQSIAYTVEVYRRRQRAEHHLGYFALYVMFYPQLVAGPIERPQNLLPQLRAERAFDAAAMAAGLKRMTWGLVKKMVIADRLALVVNEVYGNPWAHRGAPLAVATVFFALQIYCDFSGYSDIAVGAAQTMGIRLMTNFDRPYAASSVAEFWRRWHISLSTFFRDYVYVPLGGNRTTRVRRWGNVLVTFALSGLWHGARWTFVVWGVLHGLAVIASDLGSVKPPRWLGTALTFSFVTVAWIFFRAPTLGGAFDILFGMFEPTHDLVGPPGFLFGSPARNVVLGAAGIVVVLAVESLGTRSQRERALSTLARAPLPLRLVAYASVLIALLELGVAEEIPFIYFQF